MEIADYLNIQQPMKNVLFSISLQNNFNLTNKNIFSYLKYWKFGVL